jgi:hypothetical protein
MDLCDFILFILFFIIQMDHEAMNVLPVLIF